MTYCKRSSAVFQAATFLLLLALIINIVGFVSPFWSTRIGDYEGLHLICTGGVCTNNAGNPLTDSNWFVTNQVLQAVGLVLAAIASIIAFVFLCSFCIDACFNVCGIVVTILVFLASILLVVGLTVYGIFAKFDNPSVQYLVSYWLTLAAAVLYFINGILFSFAVDKEWKHDTSV